MLARMLADSAPPVRGGRQAPTSPRTVQQTVTLAGAGKIFEQPPQTGAPPSPGSARSGYGGSGSVYGNYSYGGSSRSRSKGSSGKSTSGPQLRQPAQSTRAGQEYERGRSDAGVGEGREKGAHARTGVPILGAATPMPAPNLGAATPLPAPSNSQSQQPWWLPSFAEEMESVPEALSLRPPSLLRVVTWNVWFSPHRAHQRMTALFAELLSYAPDVACLQEVLPDLASSLRTSATLCRVYDISTNDVAPYGVLLLVRKSLRATISEMQLPTKMGRKLVLAEFDSSGGVAADFGLPPLTCAVATVHLESLDNVETRKAQLQVASARLQPYDCALLCGDFNFDSTCTWGDWRSSRSITSPRRYVRPSSELENSVLADVLPGYVDTWPAVHPGDPGHTFDGKSNPYVPDANERMRYDRVLTRGAAPLAVSILGQRARASPIAPAPMHPSDHYGLSVDVNLAVALDMSASSSSGGGWGGLNDWFQRPVDLVGETVLGLPVAIMRPVMKFRLGFGNGFGSSNASQTDVLQASESRTSQRGHEVDV